MAFNAAKLATLVALLTGFIVVETVLEKANVMSSTGLQTKNQSSYKEWILSN